LTILQLLVTILNKIVSCCCCCFFLFVFFNKNYSPKVIGSNKKSGRIIQRFPEDDLIDCEFDNNIHCFCQPHGWKIYSKQEPPTFFVSILTDVRAQRRYCACLTFLEPVQQITKCNKNNTISSSSTSNNNNNGLISVSSIGNFMLPSSLDDSNFINSDEYEDCDYINENLLDSNNYGKFF
jgi:hypothetical protein